MLYQWRQDKHQDWVPWSHTLRSPVKPCSGLPCHWDDLSAGGLKCAVSSTVHCDLLVSSSFQKQAHHFFSTGGCCPATGLSSDTGSTAKLSVSLLERDCSLPLSFFSVLLLALKWTWQAPSLIRTSSLKFNILPACECLSFTTFIPTDCHRALVSWFQGCLNL